MKSRTLSARPARQAIWDDSLAELRRRWGEALKVDPGFNPHFARTGRPFELMTEPSPDDDPGASAAFGATGPVADQSFPLNKAGWRIAISAISAS